MAPKPILLHIGTPKTGSTSIQDSLARAEREGSLDGIRYPLRRGDSHHLWLVPLYRSHEDLPPWWRHKYPANDSRFQRMRRQFRDFLFTELRAARGAILSAEGLCLFTPELVGRLRRDLESLGFTEFRVVLYVRDPADYFLSRTQQRLKSASGPWFVEDPAGFRYGFRLAAETWERIFPGCLSVRGYPSSPLHDVVDDFAEVVNEFLGVTVPRPPVRMNTTLSAEGMRILDEYRRRFCPDGAFTPDVQSLVSFLQQSDVTQTRPALKREFAHQIRANHAADAEAILQRYGVDLGLRGVEPPAGPVRTGDYRIDDIVESVDPDIVHELLLRLARVELGRRPAQRPLPLRLAARAYRAVPAAQKPAALDRWLRSRIDR